MIIIISFTKEQAAMLQPLLALITGSPNNAQRVVTDQSRLYPSPGSSYFASPSISNSKLSDTTSSSPPSGQYSVEDMLRRKAKNTKSSRAQAYIL